MTEQTIRTLISNLSSIEADMGSIQDDYHQGVGEGVHLALSLIRAALQQETP